MRTGKELLIATNQYTQEQTWLSWWHLFTSIAALVTFTTLACLDISLWVRIPACVLAGLSQVRMFVFYHDYMHGAILRDSRLAGWILKGFGMLELSPPYIWKLTHDDHHQNNAKQLGPTSGTFPIMSVEDYNKATFWEKVYYNVYRHPLMLATGYITVFFWEISLHSFLVNPKKHLSGGIAVALHLAMLITVGMFSISAMLLGFVMPMCIASALGAYLFYAQHNFPGMRRRVSGEWNYVDAALYSSSFMRMNPIMHWFTANIGYHHVHHLNHKIPFYRLPEAMAGLEELQSPVTTSLHPMDILHCLRLKLWDSNEDRLVTFREAAELTRVSNAEESKTTGAAPTIAEAATTDVAETAA